MSSIDVSIIVFSILFGASLLGMYIGSGRLMKQLNDESLSHIRLSVALVTSMFALLLSLQLSSSKTSFDTQEQEVTVFGFEGRNAGPRAFEVRSRCGYCT